ncbi:hypothetical protein ACFX1T_002913 [Malus domestica]
MDLGKISRANSMDEEFEFLEIEDGEELLGLTHWEFIDASDADSEENHHHHRSDSEQTDKDEEANRFDRLIIGPASFSPSIPPPVADPIPAQRRRRPHLVRFVDVGLNLKLRSDWDDGSDEDEGHGEEEEDGYGLDDELVPWSVSDKFGRQRMRKLGKRMIPKTNNSKRSPYMVARPGCREREVKGEEEEPCLNPPLPCSVAPTVTTFGVSPALNHHQVLLSLISSLSPSIDVEQNWISVYNNVAGVPVEIHQEERVYIPELNFGHLLTSSNYYDTVKKTTGGRNGYGPKLTNIFSTKFIIETTDVKVEDASLLALEHEGRRALLAEPKVDMLQ